MSMGNNFPVNDYFWRKSVKALGIGSIIHDDPRVMNLISVFKEIAQDQREACARAFGNLPYDATNARIFDTIQTAEIKEGK